MYGSSPVSYTHLDVYKRQAYTIQALTTTLYAMHVSSDQVPVYKAIVVVIIVTLQSPGFERWRKSLTKKKELKLAEKEAA